MNTKIHPEFIWATFEHVSNAPNCTVDMGTGFTTPQPADGWNLVGPNCNACVSDHYQPGIDLLKACSNECDWNPSSDVQPKAQLDANGNAVLHGKASDVCLIEYLGTSKKQSGAETNIDNIEFLNTLLTGPNGLIAKQGSSDLQVLQNYFLAGAVWTNMATFDMKSNNKFNSDMAGSRALTNSSINTGDRKYYREAHVLIISSSSDNSN